MLHAKHAAAINCCGVILENSHKCVLAVADFWDELIHQEEMFPGCSARKSKHLIVFIKKPNAACDGVMHDGKTLRLPVPSGF